MSDLEINLSRMGLSLLPTVAGWHLRQHNNARGWCVQANHWKSVVP